MYGVKEGDDILNTSERLIKSRGVLVPERVM
jgi:hypothetical protein